jgi:hypothetical protein
MPRQRADVQIAPNATRQDFTYQPPDLPAELPGKVGVRVEFDEADMLATPTRWVEASVWSSTDGGVTWRMHVKGRREGGPGDPNDTRSRPYLYLALGSLANQPHFLDGRDVELRVTADSPFQYSVHAIWDYDA